MASVTTSPSSAVQDGRSAHRADSFVTKRRARTEVDVESITGPHHSRPISCEDVSAVSHRTKVAKLNEAPRTRSPVQRGELRYGVPLSSMYQVRARHHQNGDLKWSPSGSLLDLANSITSRYHRIRMSKLRKLNRHQPQQLRPSPTFTNLDPEYLSFENPSPDPIAHLNRPAPPGQSSSADEDVAMIGVVVPPRPTILSASPPRCSTPPPDPDPPRTAGALPTVTRKKIPSLEHPQPNLNPWLSTFQNWDNAERLLALRQVIQLCQPSQIRQMMKIIEPLFQRDFISLLPKELALYVLSFLSPEDLLRSAQTCRKWRLLAQDNLLWREKCREFNIRSPFCDSDTFQPAHPRLIEGTELVLPGTGGSSTNVSHWKNIYITDKRVDANWRKEPIKKIKVLKGHDDHVITCLQFDGNYIVSGSDDNTLKVWSTETGECIVNLVGHTGGVWSSEMRGKIVISGSTDRTLKVWHIGTGKCVHTLQGHTSTVRCMSLKGNKVVSGSRDATLRVWDVVTGACDAILIGHVAAVRCVQYDGRRVVSGAYDFLVKVWDPATEQCIHTLHGHSNRVYSLQFDGVHIVSGSLDTSIRIWDVESGNCLHTLIGHQSLTSRMELKSNLLVSGNADSTVKIWDTASGQCLHTLQGTNKHQSAVTCLQFDGKTVVTSSDDGTVKLWDARTGEFVRDLIKLDSGGSGGVVWRIKCTATKLVCAVGSRNGTEDTKLLVLDFGAKNEPPNPPAPAPAPALLGVDQVFGKPTNCT